MVLTDDQLNDLAQWVRRRSALHRYVEGWGVVRGLGVRCDPASPGCVVVGPGYARSCCGDDIVICQDTVPERLRLPAREPVLRRQPQPGAGEGARVGGPEGGRRLPAVQRDAAGPGQGHGQLRVRRPRRRGVRAGGGGRHADLRAGRRCGTDPATLLARNWDQGYAACARVVHDYLREVSDRAGGEDRRKWILGWIDRAGDDTLCCIRRRLCCRRDLGEARGHRHALGPGLGAQELLSRDDVRPVPGSERRAAGQGLARHRRAGPLRGGLHRLIPAVPAGHRGPGMAASAGSHQRGRPHVATAVHRLRAGPAAGPRHHLAPARPSGERRRAGPAPRGRFGLRALRRRLRGLALPRPVRPVGRRPGRPGGTAAARATGRGDPGGGPWPARWIQLASGIRVSQAGRPTAPGT